MITLYSTGCPSCNVLKQKLDRKQIPYTENNSVDEMLRIGIMQAPVLIVDGEQLTFSQANEWVNHYIAKEGQTV